MNIPDQPEALAGWLERQLVGLDLAELVAELEAIHVPVKPLSLDDVLGGGRQEVLDRGLGSLPETTLRRLLRQPGLLHDLQELVLEHGGAYWAAVDAGGEMEVAFQRGEQRLMKQIRERPPGTQPMYPRKAILTPKWYRLPSVVSLATAAAVLLAVGGLYLWLGSPHSSNNGQALVVASAWGWSKPDALPQNASPMAYLNKLADESEEWFNKRPDEPLALARRIGEFRQGCSTLILAAHKPLKDEDRRWLVGRCQAWAQKLDQQLAALEKGEDATVVRTEVDAIVNQLTAALRTRAQQVESA